MNDSNEARDDRPAHGRPCIRGMRITVSDVLGMLAGGMTRAQILKDYPYLEYADIDAAVDYAKDSSTSRNE